MSFQHKKIEYFLGLCSTTFTLSIPAFKNYFKVLEVKEIDTAHSKAHTIIEDELYRLSKEKSNNI